MVLVMFAPRIANDDDNIVFKVEISEIIQDSNLDEIEDFEDEIK